MRWWVFNQKQLDAALTRWAQDGNSHGSIEILRLQRDLEAVQEFLQSDAARIHKLRGDPE